ncbi:2-polyprenyl-6-methoxyphenol hydroxylase [Actinokineospora alba]|uniref:2-polyprenyl-6-methoxyphenol hydroxylase n=1 Tax=Actinokineospora alba TaxID=504798 RepID=A0A1H0F1T5_9PSEU|nr:2-polyprenyl-6-methoxyphenol hydroxylase-like oxidoreductase [Actinokineospora alba]TDP69306.1 2-polyprenyl-6-methoxyphenol hydroxylase-like FAD-dependent oxidoreductase [Actinokineospora alba]SDI19682.1 2-polyprenyl-6-methoxyphenol hydroxylase [Actinokineospora alba]SDN88571.1 2-polyprenyl-6-methoxyphenol hydroxylase [Actinokineospora alba]
MRTIGDHAVVLGASMGGLLAARVLADSYRRVTVVERDSLPDSPDNRRGVPQGRHVHALQPKGAQIIDGLFPGILADLIAAGAPVIGDDQSQMHFSAGGHLLRGDGVLERPLSMYLPSRPLLEWHTRERLRALSTVDIIDRCTVVGPRGTDDGSRVTGIEVQEHGSPSRVIDADLVVDAMGRGARTPAWLEQLGYPRPAEDKAQVDVTYVSVLLRIPQDALWEKLVLIGPRPGTPKGFALFSCENDTRVFSIAGMAGVRPPADRAEMIDFVSDIAPARMLSVVREADQLGEVVTHRFPAGQWRRYDKLRRFPAGLIVVGDAICSFNPLYGQGMTVAALQARTLADCLRGGDRDLARRFFRATAKPVGIAWDFATRADLALPEIAGPRTTAVRISVALSEYYLRAAETDRRVSEQLFRISGFMDPPSKLFGPRMLLRAIAANRRRGDTTGHAEHPMPVQARP